MTMYLAHHRSFCEELGRLSSLAVSWDGQGGTPLRRKSLLSAVELFGRRPDLTIGAELTLDRGGLRVTLFRGGRDLQIDIYKEGALLVAGHRPASKPDFNFTSKTVTEPFLEKLDRVVPYGEGAPFLCQKNEHDVCLSVPFFGFSVLRLKKAEAIADCRLYVGREGILDEVYAFHDATDLPGDVFVDQPLTGQNSLLDLVTSYTRTRSGDALPV